MKPITIRDIEIGTGIPKICVPLVAKNQDDLLLELKELAATSFDMIEWRIDCFEEVENKELLLDALHLIRAHFPKSVLLVTFRTIYEGGNKVTEHYQDIYRYLIKTKQIDLIDIEAFLGDELFIHLRDYAHQHRVLVVASNHDFSATPDKKEILKRFKKMNELGADILKIALMPQSLEDVLTLLSATHQASEKYEQPLITMSMSKKGFITRVCGEVFGSSVTFGSVKEASAPGQISANKLNQLLSLLNEGL